MQQEIKYEAGNWNLLWIYKISAAQAVAGNLTPDKINSELEKAGLPQAEILESPSGNLLSTRVYTFDFAVPWWLMVKKCPPVPSDEAESLALSPEEKEKTLQTGIVIGM